MRWSSYSVERASSPARLCVSYKPSAGNCPASTATGRGSKHLAIHAIENYWVLLAGDDEALRLIYNEQIVFFQEASILFSQSMSKPTL